MIYLRFIGKNGSMGLIHGEIYKVKIVSNNQHIWVYWNSGSCPYYSPQDLANNWEA